MLGGGAVEDNIYTDSINLNLFFDEQQICAQVQNLLSGIDNDILDEECVELFRRIPVDTAGELPGPETSYVSVIFEVEISVEFMVRMVVNET
ncbi:hypothetical protein MKX03_000800 [Papaver bracteatum]|nr:hypothetical protein MKX03_000800 [Papaver bracteatum]